MERRKSTGTDSISTEMDLPGFSPDHDVKYIHVFVGLFDFNAIRIRIGSGFTKKGAIFLISFGVGPRIRAEGLI